MNPLSIAAQVVHAATGEAIQATTCLTPVKGSLQDFEVVTETARIFTVTLSTRAVVPLGHFFEGKDPTRAQLTNFRFIGETKVEL